MIPCIELSGVTKRFGPQTAVNQLDLQVPEGSLFGFIGPNGSGKTTTLRMILRIYQPDGGRVVVLGSEQGDTADHRVGYLPEERGLYKRMIVRDVLRYFAQLKGLRRPDDTINDWLQRMQASEFARKRIEQLSKGMAQKIQFIAAVVARPKLVILDEPFSGLDPVNAEVMRAAIKHLRSEGTTIIFSTHDMHLAQEMCERLMMIYKGNKVLDGTLEEIRQQHGQPTVRVRMASGTEIPHQIDGVIERIAGPTFVDLRLRDEAARLGLARRLSALGELEHFELVRPTLHDIFVRIAGENVVEVSHV